MSKANRERERERESARGRTSESSRRTERERKRRRRRSKANRQGLRLTCVLRLNDIHFAGIVAGRRRERRGLERGAMQSESGVSFSAQGKHRGERETER